MKWEDILPKKCNVCYNSVEECICITCPSCNGLGKYYRTIKDPRTGSSMGNLISCPQCKGKKKIAN